MKKGPETDGFRAFFHPYTFVTPHVIEYFYLDRPLRPPIIWAKMNFRIPILYLLYKLRGYKESSVPNMKHVLTYLLALALVLSGMLFPSNGIEFSEATGNIYEYDGFLVGLSEEQTVHLFSDMEALALEPVSDTVYWVQDWEDVERLSSIVPVTYVEPNYIATLFDEESEQPTPVTIGWPYEAVSAGYAAQHDLTGQGVRIAIIDSGVDLNNSDLQNAAIGEGYDYILQTSQMCDTVYHGTKIAQIISGDQNNAGLAGIAPSTEIIPLRCFSATSGGTVKMLAQAIYDAVDIYQCDIINMSWGLNVNSETLKTAVDYAYEAGTILVAAAGNVSSRYPQGTKMYPASYDEVISVSSVDAALSPSATSQANECVFLCAPGENIPFVDADGAIVQDSGTSFSSPCVAAGIALLLQLAPTMDSEAVFSILEERAVDLGDEGIDTAYGHGLLRLDALIGQTWNWMPTPKEGEEAQVFPRLLGWCVNSGGSQVLLGSYNQDGQMTDIQLMSSSTDILSFDVILSGAGTASCLVTYLNNKYEVLTGCDRYEVDTGS